MVRGDGLIPAWRLMDAQYWGGTALSQRKRRVFVVADFAENVPQKYYLSPAVCSRILALRLAEAARRPRR